jgi:hypothetical protein
MFRGLYLPLAAALSIAAISGSAEAATPKKGISYYSAPVTAAGPSRSKRSTVARLSSTIPGVRDRAASPFGRQANGHAFFDNQSYYP